jgi:hypothetical protein
MNKKALVSYAQSLLATILTAMLAMHKSPLDFTANDWKLLANSVWVAIIPVAIRALSKSDTAFGLGSNTPVSSGDVVDSQH